MCMRKLLKARFHFQNVPVVAFVVIVGSGNIFYEFTFNVALFIKCLDREKLQNVNE